MHTRCDKLLQALIKSAFSGVVVTSQVVVSIWMYDGWIYICYSPLGGLDESNPDVTAILSSNFSNTLIKQSFGM